MTRASWWLWLGLVCSGPAVPAWAQAPAPAPVMPSPLPARVRVSVRVVVATQEAPRLDERLAAVAPMLTKTGFSSFTSAGSEEFLLADGASGRVVLPDGRTVHIQLTRHQTEDAQLVVRTERPGAEAVETSISVRRNRAFVMAVRTPQPDRAFLLLIDARY